MRTYLVCCMHHDSYMSHSVYTMALTSFMDMNQYLHTYNQCVCTLSILWLNQDLFYSWRILMSSHWLNWHSVLIYTTKCDWITILKCESEYIHICSVCMYIIYSAIVLYVVYVRTKYTVYTMGLTSFMDMNQYLHTYNQCVCTLSILWLNQDLFYSWRILMSSHWLNWHSVLIYTTKCDWITILKCESEYIHICSVCMYIIYSAIVLYVVYVRTKYTVYKYFFLYNLQQFLAISYKVSGLKYTWELQDFIQNSNFRICCIYFTDSQYISMHTFT